MMSKSHSCTNKMITHVSNENIIRVGDILWDRDIDNSKFKMLKRDDEDMKFINRVQKFMYGRYGPDELCSFLLKWYFILLIIDIFLNNYILSILELIIIILVFYRFLSKNIYARSRENQQFIKCKKNLLKPFVNIKRNITDRDHIYKKCHKCKTILKLPLPSKRGIRHAKCPNCGKRITLFAWKYQKIEIIKNKGRMKS